MGWNLFRIAQNITQSDDINTTQNLVLAYKTNYKIVSNAEPNPTKLFDGIKNYYKVSRVRTNNYLLSVPSRLKLSTMD